MTHNRQVEVANLRFYYFYSMKILLTGANGFLGYYLSDLLTNAGLDLLATSRGDCRLPFSSKENFNYLPLDFTEENSVYSVVESYGPDYIIHAGAMGKPDDCELYPELADLINVEGTRFLLSAARRVNAHFCYISTDFVFDGKEGNYKESAVRSSVNHYGLTKLRAEELVEAAALSWSIVRTVLVYGRPMTGRSNLLSIVHDKLSKGESYQVVDDQIRTPTYVGDLALGIFQIINQAREGLYHLCGHEVLTPYQMALQAAAYLSLDTSLVVRTDTASFKQVAQRPLRTGLSIEKARRELGFLPLTFQEGLLRTFGPR
jgi:dTDP-4-dehydrorhamnose reductase